MKEVNDFVTSFMDHPSKSQIMKQKRTEPREYQLFFTSTMFSFNVCVKKVTKVQKFSHFLIKLTNIQFLIRFFLMQKKISKVSNWQNEINHKTFFFRSKQNAKSRLRQNGLDK